MNISNRLPSHVGIIMDGNGRWAVSRGFPRTRGHEEAVYAVRTVTEYAAELGIQYLSLFAFSVENWGRPKEETDILMNLLVEFLHSETPTLMKNNIKCVFIGDRTHLEKQVIEKVEECVKTTSRNTHMTLVIAFNYSGKWDILQAAEACLKSRTVPGKQPLTQDEFACYLSTAGIPDPDLLIRTSGEMRISNFMLWQLAYTELYFTPVLWPDFRKPDFEAALEAYSNRQRRFGKTEE